MGLRFAQTHAPNSVPREKSGMDSASESGMAKEAGLPIRRRKGEGTLTLEAFKEEVER